MVTRTLATLLALATPAGAQTPAEFFRGKTVDFIIGYPPGGGYDIFGRALAQHIGRHIPGQPNVVVRNMPGASSLKAVQYLATTAPRDGTAFGVFNSNLITTAMTDPKTINVDMGSLTWLGNMVSDTKTCFAWRANGITDVGQLREKTLVIGGTSRGSAYVYGSLLQQAFGEARVKIVLGYPSNIDAYLAMERGEVGGICTGYDIIKQLRPEWIAGNRLAFLVQYGDTPEPGLETVPRVYDLPLAEPMKAAARFYIAADRIARPVAAPPGVPADRTAALREAFDRTLADPVFHEASVKAHMEVQPMNAAELIRTVNAIRATPPDVVDVARRLAE